MHCLGSFVNITSSVVGKPYEELVLLQRKSEGEHEASRRLKTQFLIEMEGFDSGSEQILLIGDWPFFFI